MTKPISDEELDELKRLLEKASEGPWAIKYVTVHGKRYGLEGIVGNGDLLPMSGSGGAKSYTEFVVKEQYPNDCSEDNYALIVALRNLAPRLLSHYARNDGIEEAAKVVLSGSVGGWDNNLEIARTMLARSIRALKSPPAVRTRNRR